MRGKCSTFTITAKFPRPRPHVSLQITNLAHVIPKAMNEKNFDFDMYQFFAACLLLAIAFIITSIINSL